MKCKPGKLYKLPEFYMLVYPSKEKAATAAAEVLVLGATTDASISFLATYWSRELKCQVRYSIPGEIFMFLGRDGEFLNVLFGDKQGWIIYKGWPITMVNNVI